MNQGVKNGEDQLMAMRRNNKRQDHLKDTGE